MTSARQRRNWSKPSRSTRSTFGSPRLKGPATIARLVPAPFTTHGRSVGSTGSSGPSPEPSGRFRGLEQWSGHCSSHQARLEGLMSRKARQCRQGPGRRGRGGGSRTVRSAPPKSPGRASRATRSWVGGPLAGLNVLGPVGACLQAPVRRRQMKVCPARRRVSLGWPTVLRRLLVPR